MVSAVLLSPLPGLAQKKAVLTDRAKVWEFYLQLSEIEGEFKNLMGDLANRPIHHLKPHHGTHFRRLHGLLSARHLEASAQAARPRGLTPRVVLEKLAGVQLLDAFPTTDGRELVFTRYTQREPDQQLLFA